MATYGGAPTIVTDGLIFAVDAANYESYTSGSNIWSDLVGNNNGTLTNGPTFDSENGGSIVFDGVNDYAILPRVVQDDFTLSCWFKTTQSYGNQTPIDWWRGVGLIDAEVPSYRNDFGITMQAGKIDFGIGKGSNPDTTIQSTLTYNDNNWHHVVGTRDRASGIINLYVDANFITSGVGGTNSLTSPSFIRIGSLQTNINFFNGNISNVQIYNRALTSTEITQNYNALKSRFGL